MPIDLTVNGQPQTVDVPPDKPLLWVLREDLGLTGTKFGCGIAQCGSCTVHLNGSPTRACVLPVSAAAGQEVTTVEGVSGDAAMAVRNAWRKLDVVQCGYCQSGQMMSATSLLASNPSPSDEEINRAMRGNVCRCATYVRIRDAIHEAAKELEA
ncbi:MAG: (2Fe-2S)-binding protein [Xanthomonadales bacterium]|nr:(2Fe-2S)-binding protein [Xanthomonadales bacterium]